jgi:hypothetical protein
MPVRHILNVTHSPIDHVATDFFRLERRYHGLPAAHRPHIQTLIESATAQFVRAMKEGSGDADAERNCHRRAVTG